MMNTLNDIISELSVHIERIYLVPNTVELSKQKGVDLQVDIRKVLKRQKELYGVNFTVDIQNKHIRIFDVDWS